jgi:hypothetical protein
MNLTGDVMFFKTLVVILLIILILAVLLPLDLLYAISAFAYLFYG